MKRKNKQIDEKIIPIIEELSRVNIKQLSRNQKYYVSYNGYMNYKKFRKRFQYLNLKLSNELQELPLKHHSREARDDFRFRIIKKLDHTINRIERSLTNDKYDFNFEGDISRKEPRYSKKEYPQWKDFQFHKLSYLLCQHLHFISNSITIIKFIVPRDKKDNPSEVVKGSIRTEVEAVNREKLTSCYSAMKTSLVLGLIFEEMSQGKCNKKKVARFIASNIRTKKMEPLSESRIYKNMFLEDAQSREWLSSLLIDLGYQIRNSY